ncbi:MAG: TIGR00270 family protein [Promethearchaeota archaeon]|nr:MAG: TIGR00270 family protein [Candidatus Lokiarchaeota archaeon]
MLLPLGFDEEERRCPICDGIIWKGQKVLIESVKMTVCNSCAQYGKKLITKPKSTSSYSARPKGSSRNSINKMDEVEIVPDYAKIIRNVRTLKKLNQDQFAQKLNEKPSLLRRIESAKVKPTIKLAKKIEKVYNVILLKKSDEIEVNTKKYMKKQTSSNLGDIAFIKKKK